MARLAGLEGLHPAQIVCWLPNKPPSTSDGILRAVLYGDTHWPFACPKTLAIIGAVIDTVRPHVLIHMGDLLDCYSLSSYEQDPARRGSLQSEINLAAAHLGNMSILAPYARRIYLEGNHEDRLRRRLWAAQGGAEALLSLDVVKRELTWPRLLSLDKSKWEFIPYQEQTRHELLPKMVVKHGHVVRKWSARSAQGEWEKYSRSGASGHVHRLGEFYHRKYGETNHFWVETGCSCTLDPDYMPDPDWINGCVVLTFDTDTGAAQVETVNIARGIAVYRDQVYRA